MLHSSYHKPIISGSANSTSVGPDRVPSSTSPQLILSGSAGSFGSRRFATIYNHSNAALYLSPKSTVTVNSFSVKLSSGSYFEMVPPVYDGPVYGVWDAANGWAMVTDYRDDE